MNRPPRADEPVSAEERADAAAWMAHRRCPSPETAKARQAAFFALTGGDLKHFGTTRCEQCACHRSYLRPDQDCRLCGYKPSPS